MNEVLIIILLMFALVAYIILLIFLMVKAHRFFIVRRLKNSGSWNVYGPKPVASWRLLLGVIVYLHTAIFVTSFGIHFLAKENLQADQDIPLNDKSSELVKSFHGVSADSFSLFIEGLVAASIMSLLVIAVARPVILKTYEGVFAYLENQKVVLHLAIYGLIVQIFCYQFYTRMMAAVMEFFTN